MVKIRIFPDAIGLSREGALEAYEGRVYTSKMNSSMIIILVSVAAQRTRATHACTHVCYLGGFISALARGIFPRDERTMSVAKRKTRAARKKIYMGRSTGMRFREKRRRRRMGASKQESYEWTRRDEENWNAKGRHGGKLGREV